MWRLKRGLIRNQARDPAAVVAVPATFDGTPSASVVLSNGNRTVTHGNTDNGAGVSSLTTKTSGKYYFEIAVTLWTSGNGNGVGVGNYYTGTFAEFLGSFANGVGVNLGNLSEIFSQGTNTHKDLGPVATADVIGGAIDMDAKLAWYRRSNGNWNADALANPATGTGGVSFTQGTVAPFVRFSNSDPADAFTGNFGQAAYANAAPSGFNSWSV